MNQDLSVFFSVSLIRLEMVLGSSTVRAMRLTPNVFQDEYDAKRDATVTNEFPTAAMRFGHTLVKGTLDLFNHLTLSKSGQFELSENFMNSEIYQNDGRDDSGFQSILAGLLMQNAEESDRCLVDDLTRRLFFNRDAVAGDLLDRNIQRGRDHGLPGYNDYRELCGLPRACSFAEEDRPEQIKQEFWAQFASIYDSPNDIDLFSAGIVEDQFNGGLLGETFNCLLSKQFSDIKFGDRFFYTFDSNPNPFTLLQKKNILFRNLGDIICDTTDLRRVRANVFDADSPVDYDCRRDKTDLNLSLFFS